MREGLRMVLSSTQGIEIVGEAQTGDEAVAQSCRLAPDVILMDLNMTGKGHVSHILAKLGVKNRAQVALYAARYKDK